MPQMSSLSSLGTININVVNGAKTPNAWANEVTAKIVSVAPTALPETRMAARAFQNEIHRVVSHNIGAAILADLEQVAYRLDEHDSDYVMAYILDRVAVIKATMGG